MARGAVTAAPRLAMAATDATAAWFAGASPAAAATVSVWGLLRIGGGLALAAAAEGTRFETPRFFYKGIADTVAGIGLVAAANGAGTVGLALA